MVANQPLRDHRSTRAPQPVEGTCWALSKSIPAVSFSTALDDRMSIAASEGEPELSGEEDSATVPQ